MTKTIMIVDDSATMLMSIEAILSSGGSKVVKCASGEEALDSLKGGTKPNLVITDLHMGGINGIQLIRKIRELGVFKFTPILVLTTSVQDSQRTEAKAAGATGWLLKPVEADALLQVVRQVLPGA